MYEKRADASRLDLLAVSAIRVSLQDHQWRHTTGAAAPCFTLRNCSQQVALWIGYERSAAVRSNTETHRTSSVLEHSLSGTLGTAQAIIIAVGKPLMAKLADV